MSKLDTGGPARPTNVKDLEDGMTWLDECAMRAMQSLLLLSDCKCLTNEQISEASFALASAMLAEKRRLEGGGE